MQVESQSYSTMIDADLEGEPITLYFNARMLRSILKAVWSNIITLCISDERDGVHVYDTSPDGESEAWLLIQPLVYPAL
jgi:hypothetical protein